jgi:hypothetical protein
VDDALGVRVKPLASDGDHGRHPQALGRLPPTQWKSASARVCA